MRDTENIKRVIPRYNEGQSSAISLRADGHSTFNGLSSQGGGNQPCLCGNMERWRDCPYLVPETRPHGWTPDPAIKTKVDEALKNEKAKTAVEMFIEYSRKKENKRAGSPTSTLSSNPNMRGFMTSAPNMGSLTAFSTDENGDGYALRSS